jgi:hypothetical protein
MRCARSYGEHRECEIELCYCCQDQEGSDVSTVRYVGHGVEIEDDAVRLRRRKLEFDDDAARRSHQSKPPRRKNTGPVRAISAALARWR